MTAWEWKNETRREAEGEGGDDGAAHFAAEKYKERERVRAQRGGEGVDENWESVQWSERERVEWGER